MIEFRPKIILDEIYPFTVRKILQQRNSRLYQTFKKDFEHMYHYVFVKEMIEFRPKIFVDKTFPFHEDFRWLPLRFGICLTNYIFLYKHHMGFLYFSCLFIRDNSCSECHLLPAFTVSLTNPKLKAQNEGSGFLLLSWCI